MAPYKTKIEANWGKFLDCMTLEVTRGRVFLKVKNECMCKGDTKIKRKEEESEWENEREEKIKTNI